MPKQPTIVCHDALPGYGKSTAIIKQMTQEPDNFYFVLVPYLKEIGRYNEDLARAGDKVRLVAPVDGRRKTKSEDLYRLLAETDHNIITSHAMYEKLTHGMIGHVDAKERKRVLVIDEAINLVGSCNDTLPSDLDYLLRKGSIRVDSVGRVHWVDVEEAPPAHKDTRNACKTGLLYYIGGKFVMFEVPIAFLNVFDEVHVLTYKFKQSNMHSYLETKGLSVVFKDLNAARANHVKERIRNNITVLDQFSIDEYKLSKAGFNNHPVEIRKAIHDNIKDALKFTGFGVEELCYTYFKEFGGGPEIKEAKEDQPKFISAKENDKWRSSRQDGQPDSRGNSPFLSHVTRATNAYAYKKLMVYGLDKHADVGVVQFFSSRGVPFDQENFALSEMVQWIFRGCIRNGEPMYVAILSPRMRKLFVDWLHEDEVSDGIQVTAAKRQQYKRWVAKDPEARSNYDIQTFLKYGARKLNKVLEGKEVIGGGEEIDWEVTRRYNKWIAKDARRKQFSIQEYAKHGGVALNRKLKAAAKEVA